MKRSTASEVDWYFERYSALVYRRALVLLGNHSDAEDATQEVFLKAVKGAGKYRGDSQIATWIYRITTNYCLNQLRSRKTHQRLLADDYEHPPAVATVTPLADILYVRRLLADADDREAQTAVYVLVDGMSRAEAAAALECSERTVSNLLARFKRWAREWSASSNETEPAGLLDKAVAVKE